MCVGFFVGGLLGAKFATVLPDTMLTRIFGAALLLISVKMILGK